FACVCGQGPDARYPLLKLFLLVVVAEPYGCGLALRRPCLWIPSVEPHHGQVVGRRRRDGWDARWEPLRHVDADVGRVPILQGGEVLFAVAIAHPGLVAELDGDAVVGQASRAFLDVDLVLLR